MDRSLSFLINTSSGDEDEIAKTWNGGGGFLICCGATPTDISWINFLLVLFRQLPSQIVRDRRRHKEPTDLVIGNWFNFELHPFHHPDKFFWLLEVYVIYPCLSLIRSLFNLSRLNVSVNPLGVASKRMWQDPTKQASWVLYVVFELPRMHSLSLSVCVYVAFSWHGFLFCFWSRVG